MKKMKLLFIFLPCVILLSWGDCPKDTCSFLQGDVVFAQEDWMQEFEDVCSKTQDAMILSIVELKDLIARCDKLRPVMEKLPETQRKVYLKRLQTCKDLYVFVLETKEKN